MVYFIHKAENPLGKGELNPAQRVVISTRGGPKEARYVADHLGLKNVHPDTIIKHRVFDDDEYLATFQTKRCLDEDGQEFARYLLNYYPDAERFIEETYAEQGGIELLNTYSARPDDEQYPVLLQRVRERYQARFGFGLEGMVVYITHTLSNHLSVQDLAWRIGTLAETAKQNGASAVVLLAYSLPYGAQERGVHDLEHKRMQDEESRRRYDGQGKTLQTFFKHLITKGVDSVVFPHAHALKETMQIAEEVNEWYRPMYEQALRTGSTDRHHIKPVHLDLAPIIGSFFTQKGENILELDLSNSGKRILFLSPDAGARGFVKAVRKKSGLKNSSLATMSKRRDRTGKVVMLKLKDVEGLENGLDNMQVLVFDDAIRSGGTMQRNIEVLRGVYKGDMRRDERLLGTPERVLIYATRTNFTHKAVDVLSSKSIDGIVITNSDARGFTNFGMLEHKTLQIYINFMMATAAKCLERGEDPNRVLTPEFIRENDLLKVDLPHGLRHHRGNKGYHYM